MGLKRHSDYNTKAVIRRQIKHPSLIPRLFQRVRSTSTFSKFMMDISSAEWLSDLAMEEEQAMIQQCQQMMMMSSQVMNWEGLNRCFDPSDLIIDTKPSSESLIHTTTVSPGDMQAENNSGWSSCASSSRVSGQLISFGNSDYFDDGKPKSNNKKEETAVVVHDDVGDHVHGGSNYTKYSQQNKVRNNSSKFGSIGLCSQEHVLAERKRREKMTQRFHALSALVPGLKKMDKASILGDAAKYLKQLEEQVKLLEEQTASRTVESVVLVKNSNVQDPNLDHGGNSSSNENSNSSLNNPLLEIEARACNNNVLIRIHAQKDQDLVRKVLNEIENLHLTTLNFNTIPFGGYAMDITIVAQMDDDFELTIKDVVMHLRLALQQCSNT